MEINGGKPNKVYQPATQPDKRNVQPTKKNRNQKSLAEKNQQPQYAKR